MSQGLLLKPPWGFGSSSWVSEQLRSREREQWEQWEQRAGCSAGVSGDMSELQLRKHRAAKCDTSAVRCRARRGPRGRPTDQLCLSQPGVPAGTSLLPWECAPSPAPTADTAPHLLWETGKNTGMGNRGVAPGLGLA